MSTYVHTLGDSTLDNLHWMLNKDGSNATQAKDDSVEGQLQKRLNSNTHLNYQVISHAYDGFTTSSVINGDHVGKVLSIAPNITYVTGVREGKTLAYLKDRKISRESPDYFAHPLNNFKKFVEDNPKAPHYVVISVGGNTIRKK